MEVLFDVREIGDVAAQLLVYDGPLSIDAESIKKRLEGIVVVLALGSAEKRGLAGIETA